MSLFSRGLILMIVTVWNFHSVKKQEHFNDKISIIIVPAKCYCIIKYTSLWCSSIQIQAMQHLCIRVMGWPCVWLIAFPICIFIESGFLDDSVLFLWSSKQVLGDKHVHWQLFLSQLLHEVTFRIIPFFPPMWPLD